MKKQRIIFISLLVIIFIVNIFYFVMNGFSFRGKSIPTERSNKSCVYKDNERVFDYADVLSDDEEEKLTKLIQKKEDECKLDIVIVTTNEVIYDLMVYADDFYDNGMFGYDKAYGDGILIADNWLTKDSWVSTCGRAINVYDDDELDSLFEEVSKDLGISPYKGYETFVNSVASTTKSYNFMDKYGNNFIALGVALVITIIFIVVNLRNRGDEVKANKNTYTKDGDSRMINREDFFINKHVTRRKIQKNNSSSGGSHTSGGGVSHGGGGFSH